MAKANVRPHKSSGFGRRQNRRQDRSLPTLWVTGLGPRRITSLLRMCTTRRSQALSEKCVTGYNAQRRGICPSAVFIAPIVPLAVHSNFPLSEDVPVAQFRVAQIAYPAAQERLQLVSPFTAFNNAGQSSAIAYSLATNTAVEHVCSAQNRRVALCSHECCEVR